MSTKSHVATFCHVLIAVCLFVMSSAGFGAIDQLPASAGRALWVTDSAIAWDEAGVLHFRKEFSLELVPEQFSVRVSADNRYRLYVNGHYVASGPQRSDIAHWRYETLDISPWLQTGRNVIAAEIWNWGEFMPLAQHSYRTAFLLQGATSAESLIDTNQTWQVLRNEAYEFETVGYTVSVVYFAPPGEQVDGSLYPWGWQDIDSSVVGWSQATELVEPAFYPVEVEEPGNSWQLTSRSIPMMEETPIRFSRIRESSGISAGDAFLAGEEDLTIPAHSRVSLLLDQDHLTNAYMIINTSGGKGADIQFTYAESPAYFMSYKGNRDELDWKYIHGVKDRYLPDGGMQRRWRSLWFRTWRYVKVNIRTRSKPLVIHDIHGLFSAYPYEEKASFESDVPWLADMWKINWRTARMCAWETFFDTPYYEQLQYIGDTRIQALISLYMSGDDRLVRQAISHFYYSRSYDGLTQSRYPSYKKQRIPPFSLIWVSMVHDLWMQRTDDDYFRTLLPGTRSVLRWFESNLELTGLVGPIGTSRLFGKVLPPADEWPFVDWASDWDVGMPPGALEGGSVVIALQFIDALQKAAELEKALGDTDNAAHYTALADRIKMTINTKAWNEAKGMYQDKLDNGGDKQQITFSQHANVLAILVGLVPIDKRQTLMQRVLNEEGVTQASYYFSYYVLEALLQSGLGDQYIEQLTPWQDMLALGLTSTPETADPTRSDSHAWSAHPNYGLLATVLGIRPAEPGFASVRIAPHLGAMRHAKGKIPHPLGMIEVAYVKRGQDEVFARITLPQGLQGIFVWRGRKLPLKEGYQELVLNAAHLDI